MEGQTRAVLDTNVLVSAALRSGSPPHRALLKARVEALLLASEETLAELREVLRRPKFDRTVELALRDAVFDEYARQCCLVPILHSIRACRDPKDDKFLDVAVNGWADLIVTGDRDLLVLHPFRGIDILTPAEYLKG
jgi:uncharacterized protein